jgi:transcriptional regulator with XRE-family HTH domain
MMSGGGIIKNLVKLRKDADMSQFELAEILGVSQQTISKYENGTREPDNATLIKLSEIFNCSVDYLLDRTTIKDPIETIAAHHDGDDWTEEELEDIERFKEFVRMKRQQREKKD